MTVAKGANGNRVDSVVILSNVDSVQRMLAAEAEWCAHEVLYVQPLPESDATVLGRFEAMLEAILERGVTIRSIIPRLALESKVFRCRVKRLIELRAEVRASDEIPGGLTVFDGSVAFITRPARRAPSRWYRDYQGANFGRLPGRRLRTRLESWHAVPPGRRRI
jgi:hypothetical protein